MDANSGKLLYHPAFANYFRDNFKHQKKFNKYSNYDDYFHNSFINVEQVEKFNTVDFMNVKKMMMSKNTGMHSIKFDNQNQNWTMNLSAWWKDRNNHFGVEANIVYHWRRILNSPYVIVIVAYHKDPQLPFYNAAHLIKHVVLWSKQELKFINHRLDYSTNSKLKLCRYFNQLATLGKCFYFFKKIAFNF